MRNRLASAVVMTAAYGMSNIAMADGMPQKLQQGSSCWSQPPANARTVPKLHCDGLGDLDIPELYQKGFRVAAVYTDMREPNIQVYIIESQR